MPHTTRLEAFRARDLFYVMSAILTYCSMFYSLFLDIIFVAKLC